MEMTKIMERAQKVSGSGVETIPRDDPEESPTRFKGPKGVRWIVFRSKLLDDRFVLVYDKRDLQEVRETYPGLAIYFPPEAEELIRNADHPEHVKTVHLFKKILGGWIIPFDSPLYRKYTKPNGGGNNGTSKREGRGRHPGQRGKNPPRKQRR